MRILSLELKRVLKTRATWLSVGIALLLSVVTAFRVVSFAQHTDVDKSGNEVKITGMEAIRANKETMKPYEGPVTEEKLRQSLIIFQEVYKKYGKDIPIEVIHQKLSPIDPFLSMIYDVYPVNDYYYDTLSKIDPDEISDFYTQRTETLKNELSADYPDNADILKTALSLNQKVTTPLVFYEGYTSDAAENLALLIVLLVLICIIIVSPAFSAEYQSGSDDILRCTKYGKVRLAVTKLCASLLIVFAMFAVCAGVFVSIVNNAYGWDSLRTSVQVLSAVLSFVPLTAGQAQGFTILAGFLTLLATACFTLFLSAKFSNSTSALIAAFAFWFLPILLHAVGKGNLVNIFTYLLPSGGAGWNTGNFYYQLNGATFLRVGPFSVWTPYFIAGACIVEIPVFFLLAVHAYCRHQVT